MVSIITINKNNLQGLIRTTESVISQTNLDFNWIIIDGNSIDGSIDFIKKIKFPRLKVIIEEDRGIYDAMNKGIDLIDGEDLVWLLNSGDSIASITIIGQISNLNYDIIYGNLVTVEYLGKKICEIKLKNPDNLDLLWLYSKTINHQSYLIKGHLLKNYKFNTRYKVCSDWMQIFSILWFEKHLSIMKLNLELVKYELGGYSEKYNELRKAERQDFLNSLLSEHQRITFDRVTHIVTKPEYNNIITLAKGRFRWSVFKLVLIILSK